MKFYSIITILIILFTVLLLSTKTHILWSKPCNTLDSTDEATNLNAVTPDYQVKGNSIFSDVDQDDHAISAEKNGNFVILWSEGPTAEEDIYAQRYSSDGTVVGSKFKVNDDHQGFAWQLGQYISIDFVLHQNYPNPFNPSTNIEFIIPQKSNVNLKVFNILGEEMATLISDRLSAGSYSYKWDAGSLVSGVYLYRLETEGFVQTRKMILVK